MSEKVCITCKKVHNGERKNCPKCLARQSAIRERKRELNLCPVCSRESDRGNGKMCTECLEKHSRLANLRYCNLSQEKKEAYNKRHYQAEKRMRDKRAAAGLCIRCGKVEVENGHKSCAKCLEKERQYRLAKYFR